MRSSLFYNNAAACSTSLVTMSKYSLGVRGFIRLRKSFGPPSLQQAGISSRNYIEVHPMPDHHRSRWSSCSGSNFSCSRGESCDVRSGGGDPNHDIAAGLQAAVDAPDGDMPDDDEAHLKSPCPPKHTYLICNCRTTASPPRFLARRR